jgi:hypothetical protein
VRRALVFLAIATVVPWHETLGRSVAASRAPQNSVASDLQTSHRGFRPKISLQTALNIAEKYVAAEHINVSDGWLSEARIILYGDNAKADADKAPNWLFDWITDRGHVNVLVSMSGKAMVLPSM